MEIKIHKGKNLLRRLLPNLTDAKLETQQKPHVIFKFKYTQTHPPIKRNRKKQFKNSKFIFQIFYFI